MNISPTLYATPLRFGTITPPEIPEDKKAHAKKILQKTLERHLGSEFMRHYTVGLETDEEGYTGTVSLYEIGKPQNLENTIQFPLSKRAFIREVNAPYEPYQILLAASQGETHIKSSSDSLQGVDLLSMTDEQVNNTIHSNIRHRGVETVSTIEIQVGENFDLETLAAQLKNSPASQYIVKVPKQAQA